MIFLSLTDEYSDEDDENSSDVLKQYFISNVDLELSVVDALKVCQSMNMILASPQNQDEYNFMREMIKEAHSTGVRIDQVFIDVYRSELSNNAWKSQGNEVNFDIAFESNQPDNYKGKENCLVFTGFYAYMNDVSCSMPNQFMCEQSSFTLAKQEDKSDFDNLMMFMKPIFEYDFRQSKERIFKEVYVNQKFLKASWIDARSICKSFDMDLITFENAFEDGKIRKAFETMEDLPQHFHVGATDVGSNDRWHSIASGNLIEFDIAWIKDESIDNSNHCAMMELVNGTYVYRKVHCTLVETNFMCQNLFKRKDANSDGTKNSDDEDSNEPDFHVFIDIKISAKSILEQLNLDEEDVVKKSDTSICSNEKDFFDSDGNYIKTACQASYSKSRDEACVDRGMNLFAIDSLEVEKELLSFATSIFGSGRSSTLWIDGKREPDGNWYVYSPVRSPLVMGIEGVTDIMQENVVEDSSEILVIYEKNKARPRVVGSDQNNGHYAYPAALKDTSARNRFARFKRSQPFYSRPLHKRFENIILDKNCLILSAFGDFKVDPWTCYSRMYSICEYRKPAKKEEYEKTSSSEIPLASSTPSTETTTYDKEYLDYEEEVESTTNPETSQRSTKALLEISKLEQRLSQLSICDLTEDVNSKEGEYKKSLCLIQTNLTFIEAEVSCKESGMKLYESVEDNIDRAVLRSFANLESETSVWVVRESFDPELITCTVIGIFKEAFTFIESANCKHKNWALCEYSRKDFEGKIDWNGK